MKILDFIICDDVRLEVSNKYTIVGAYNDQLVFQAKAIEEIKVPTNVRLAFYLRIDLENETRVRSIDFKVNGNPIEEVIGRFEFLTLDPTRPLIVGIGFILTVKEQGKVNFEFTCRDAQGAEIKKLTPSSNLSVVFKKI